MYYMYLTLKLDVEYAIMVKINFLFGDNTSSETLNVSKLCLQIQHFFSEVGSIIRYKAQST